MSKKIIGYVEGVFDLFHVGHLAMLKKASKLCDELIVGVYSDEIVKSYKTKLPIIKHKDRMEIVRSIRYVSRVVHPITRDDKLNTWKNIKFDVLFIGEDWKGTERWNNFEKALNKVGVTVIYIPYTKHISTTKIRQMK